MKFTQAGFDHHLRQGHLTLTDTTPGKSSFPHMTKDLLEKTFISSFDHIYYIQQLVFDSYLLLLQGIHV